MMEDLNAHSSEDQIELYALGRLPEPQHAALEGHLLICSTCRERLDGIGDFALGMREAVAQHKALPSAPGVMAWLRRPALSMGLAFALLLIGFVVFTGRHTKLAPMASLQLTAMRGAMVEVSPASSYNIDLAGAQSDAGPLRVDVVNAAGERVWSGLAESGPSGVVITVRQPLTHGVYFVRLNTAAGQMLREYGFGIR